MSLASHAKHRPDCIVHRSLDRLLSIPFCFIWVMITVITVTNTTAIKTNIPAPSSMLMNQSSPLVPYNFIFTTPVAPNIRMMENKQRMKRWNPTLVSSAGSEPYKTTVTTVTSQSGNQIVDETRRLVTNQSFTQSTSTVGYWLNLGVPYYKCPNPQDMERCEMIPSPKPGSENNALWKPDYAMLMDRITCVIQKLNCPRDNRSFQLHDIPCQSTCLSVVAACRKQLPHTGCQPQYASNTRNMFWPISSGSYVNQIGASQSYLYPYRSNIFSQPYSRYSNAFGGRFPRRMGRELYVSRYPYTTQLRRSTNLAHKDVIYGGAPNLWSRDRFRRGVLLNQAEYIPSDNVYNSLTSNSLTETDCYLLPSGGCDKWSAQLMETDQYTSVSMERNVRLNPGCPADLLTTCNSMFPGEYTRQQWVKGEFTVAAIVRIAQTLWWFGPNNRFQPFFRFHVTETLDSDIHPYDDKMILTYSWPSQCICPNEITADKTYLMLTHSVKSRQTLNITTSTVFLSRVKRYTRRLSCWKGSCIRRGHRNRRRRYPTGVWRWKP